MLHPIAIGTAAIRIAMRLAVEWARYARMSAMVTDAYSVEKPLQASAISNAAFGR